MEGVPLSEEGRRQAYSLNRRLGTRRVTGIYTSPRQRARETAEIVAERIGLTPEVTTRLDEINFELDRPDLQPARRRSGLALLERSAFARPAAGRRDDGRGAGAGLRFISEAHRARPGSTIVMVTHAEIIRAVVLHCLAWPLDAWAGVDIAPASVTTLDIRPSGSALVSLDQRAAA